VNRSPGLLPRAVCVAASATLAATLVARALAARAAVPPAASSMSQTFVPSHVVALIAHQVLTMRSLPTAWDGRTSRTCSAKPVGALRRVSPL
jgi:hypothetical protein